MNAWKILLDCVVLICTAIPIIIIELWVEPFRRGFFAEDLSIRLPYKQQSVPEIYALVGVGLVFFTILTTEVVHARSRKGNSSKFVLGRAVPRWARGAAAALAAFLFGLACEHLFITATKSAVGRLRPHFYDVCRPEYNATEPLNQGGYVQRYSCAADHDHGRLRDARLSFPSGHTAFSMYCAVFFIFYVQTKGKWRGSKLLRHALQFAAFLAAWYVGLTRIQEHYHFWSDVAVGAAVGGSFAALAFIYVLQPRASGPLPADNWDSEPAPRNVLPRPALAR